MKAGKFMLERDLKWTHNLCDTGAVLYKLSSKLVAGNIVSSCPEVREPEAQKGNNESHQGHRKNWTRQQNTLCELFWSHFDKRIMTFWVYVFFSFLFFGCRSLTGR